MKIEIVLDKPGTLRAKVNERKSDFKNADLKVVGEMNDADIKFLKQATGTKGFIKGLDLFYATGINSIDRNTFEEGGILTSIKLSNSVRNLGWGAFCMCDHLNSISFASETEQIENYSFNGCSALTTISLPRNIKEIGTQSFIGCSRLEEFKILLSNKYYSTYEGVLFNKKGDSLIKYPAGKEGKNYAIPANTFHIGDYAFFMCEKIWNLTIPEGIETIGQYAFASCQSLQTITLPTTVKHIGTGAFDNDDQLGALNILATVPPVFTPSEQDCKSLNVYVPINAVDEYKSAEGWKDMKNIFGK